MDYIKLKTCLKLIHFIKLNSISTMVCQLFDILLLHKRSCESALMCILFNYESFGFFYDLVMIFLFD
jgi:hypothetical protein